MSYIDLHAAYILPLENFRVRYPISKFDHRNLNLVKTLVLWCTELNLDHAVVVKTDLIYCSLHFFQVFVRPCLH